jgi:ribosomal protein S18 acetylase RimI-like enzyme
MAETVRKATTDDLEHLGQVISRAFYDDPAMAWAAPHDERRRRLGHRYWESLLRKVYFPKGETYMTDDGNAVALWAPPDKWKAPASAALALAPTMMRICRSKVVRAARMTPQMEKKHADFGEPHYYLAVIATDPAQQGKGLGSTLLADMLGRCDEQGIPAYLESTSVGSQALYHRHGFVAEEPMQWPGGGPPWWPMWREPTTG